MTAAPLATALATAESAVAQARERAHAYRMESRRASTLAPQTPESDLKEAERALATARADLRKSIIASVKATREQAAKEYLFRAQEFMSAYYNLSAADALLDKLLPGHGALLNPSFFHGKLTIPFPVALLPNTIHPYQNDHGAFTDAGCSSDPAAAAPVIERHVYELESRLRRDFGAWPFV